MLQSMVSRTSYLRRCTKHVRFECLTLNAGPTLAKKFEVVHRNTVTRMSTIPSVRRAIISNPSPALNPVDFRTDRDDDIEHLSWRAEDMSSCATTSPTS